MWFPYQTMYCRVHLYLEPDLYCEFYFMARIAAQFYLSQLSDSLFYLHYEFVERIYLGWQHLNSIRDCSLHFDI